MLAANLSQQPAASSPIHPMLKLWQALSDLRSSLWLIPTAMVLFAIVLAAGAVELDAGLDLQLSDLSARLFGASPEGARALLQVLAGAMMSTATLTFSITVLVLSNVATQYTPAVIRTVMSSRPTQLALGTFIGIFVYCLLVLRTVRAGRDEFVPSISITIALLLSIVGVGVLVYFVHHVATSIQAPVIVSSIVRQTLEITRKRLPALPPNSTLMPAAVARPPEGARPLRANSSGYLRDVDLRGMQAWCEKQQTRIHLDVTLGDFVCCGQTVAWVCGAVSDEAGAAFHRLYALARMRSVQQDPAVGVEQLVEIAIKAQSASTNDRGTAVLCIDRLGELLLELSRRSFSPDDEHPLVHASVPEYAGLLRFVVSRLLEAADGQVGYTILLLRMLGKVALLAEPGRRALVASQLQRVADTAQSRADSQHQAEELREVLLEVSSRLERAADGALRS